MKGKRLLRDIVIPAGTLFLDAPDRTSRSPGHIEAIVGLTRNTSGSLIYYAGDDVDELASWFSDTEE